MSFKVSPPPQTSLGFSVMETQQRGKKSKWEHPSESCPGAPRVQGKLLLQEGAILSSATFPGC